MFFDSIDEQAVHINREIAKITTVLLVLGGYQSNIQFKPKVFMVVELIQDIQLSQSMVQV